MSNCGANAELLSELRRIAEHTERLESLVSETGRAEQKLHEMRLRAVRRAARDARRDAAWLAWLGGMSARQIARVLGTSHVHVLHLQREYPQAHYSEIADRYTPRTRTALGDEGRNQK